MRDIRQLVTKRSDGRRWYEYACPPDKYFSGVPIIAFDSALERPLWAQGGVDMPRRNVGSTGRVWPRSMPGRWGGEVEGGADAVFGERAGQVPDGRVRGLPAGAVSRNDHLGPEPSGARTVSAMTLDACSEQPDAGPVKLGAAAGHRRGAFDQPRVPGGGRRSENRSRGVISVRGRGRPDKPRRTRTGRGRQAGTWFQLHVTAV